MTDSGPGIAFFDSLFVSEEMVLVVLKKMSAVRVLALAVEENA